MGTEMTEGQRAADEYKATLSDLKSNTKADINALTMLAEENKEHAFEIATCIENQLKAVPNFRKLPVLYLIDSICKNYPKSIYVQLFTQNIVSNFCKVFEVSDERVRKSLHKLRMTWNEKTKIFPQNKLNAIDERVHEMDPNWPVLHKILSQQQQIKEGKQQQQQQSQQQQPPPPQPSSQPQSHPSIPSQQPLVLPQSQQAQPMQTNHPVNTITNSAGTKRSNTNQSNGKRKRTKHNRQASQLSEPVLVPPPQTLIDPNIIQASHDLQVHPTTYMDPSITMATSDQMHQVPTATFMSHPDIIIATHEPQLPPTNQLICTPFNPTPSQTQPLSDLQPTHLSILDSLYGGKQCSNCSLRFDDNNRYAIHLDWHFRQNLKSDNMFARRKWYYPLNLWVQFREINDDDIQESTNADNNANDLLLTINDHEVPTAPASKDDEKNICSVCHETFEKFWAEEEEEWRLKNAKLYEDERVYHPLCLMDMLQANNVVNSTSEQN